MTERPELEFFNQLSGRLEIELTEPPKQVAPHLISLKAAPSAAIKALRFNVCVYEADDSRPLTEAELASVAFNAPHIRLRAESGDAIDHHAPNGSHFTVRALISAVEKTERETRSRSYWVGGIDVHHVFFEGIHAERDGTWVIYWGS